MRFRTTKWQHCQDNSMVSSCSLVSKFKSKPGQIDETWISIYAFLFSLSEKKCKYRMRKKCDLFIGKYSNIVSLLSYTNREEHVIRDRLKFSENLSRVI